jgi:hypothetical protein
VGAAVSAASGHGHDHGFMPRGRRFTLAPAVNITLPPSPAQVDVSDCDEHGDEVWHCQKGREALSKAVALAADLCRRPSLVHGV